MRKLNPIETKILTVMIKEGGYLTTAEISQKAKVSWNTAFAYLKRFEKRGWVESSGDTTKYWMAIINE